MLLTYKHKSTFIHTYTQIAPSDDFCTEYSQLQHSIVCGRQQAQQAQQHQHNMPISKQLNGNLKSGGLPLQKTPLQHH